jgi:D-arabinose 1-dehydrogenase-like Zn-dependent alcohol dehydrogenase
MRATVLYKPGDVRFEGRADPKILTPTDAIIRLSATCVCGSDLWLKRDGVLVLVGVPEHAHPSPAVFNLVSKRRSIAGSMIGGIQETQEMLDFCAEKGLVADIELIRIQQLEEAYARMLKSDVKYCFVIDNASLEERP